MTYKEARQYQALTHAQKIIKYAEGLGADSEACQAALRPLEKEIESLRSNVLEGAIA